MPRLLKRQDAPFEPEVTTHRIPVCIACGNRRTFWVREGNENKIENAWEISTPRIGLGGILLEQGDVAGAQVYLAEGLCTCRDTGNKRMGAFALEAIASFLPHQAMPYHADRLSRAACLLGAAESLRTAVGSPLPPANQKDYQSLQDQLHATLGSKVFEQSLEAGRRQDWEQAIAYALESLDGQEGTTASIRQPFTV